MGFEPFAGRGVGIGACLLREDGFECVEEGGGRHADARPRAWIAVGTLAKGFGVGCGFGVGWGFGGAPIGIGGMGAGGGCGIGFGIGWGFGAGFGAKYLDAEVKFTKEENLAPGRRWAKAVQETVEKVKHMGEQSKQT